MMQTDEQLDAALSAALRDAPDAESAVDDADLIAWRNGAVDDDRRAQIEAALASSRTLRALARAQREPVDPDLAAWAAQQAPRRGRPWRLALAAAVIIGLGAAGWYAAGLRGPPAPDYSAGPLQGAVRVMRAVDQPATGVFLPDSIVRVDLMPAAERAAPPVHVFVGPVGGPLRRVDAEPVIGLGGALRLQARAGDWFGDRAGPRTLAVALGPWPTPPTTLDDAAARTGQGRQWLRFEVDYRLALEETP